MKTLADFINLNTAAVEAARRNYDADMMGFTHVVIDGRIKTVPLFEREGAVLTFPLPYELSAERYELHPFKPCKVDKSSIRSRISDVLNILGDSTN